MRCDGETTEVLTPVVQAQRDGVHVLIKNVSELQLATSWRGGGDGAPPGDSAQVVPIPPGEGSFRCVRHDLVADEDHEGWGSFQVLAPPGWVSPFLDCEGGRSYGGNIDYERDARGTDDPLVDAQQRAKAGEVVQAGYETSDERTFVAIVDGQATESWGYFNDGYGGWLLDSTGGCSN